MRISRRSLPAFRPRCGGPSTLTTVGYGDVYPVTPLGKCLASLVMLLGIGWIAIPAGLMSSTLTEMLREKRASVADASAPPGWPGPASGGRPRVAGDGGRASGGGATVAVRPLIRSPACGAVNNFRSRIRENSGVWADNP